MKALYSLLILLTVAAGCSEKKKSSEKAEDNFSYELSGTIKNGGGKKAYLDKLDDQRWVHMDSAEIGPKGNYKFEGAIAGPDYALLQVDTQNVLIIIDQPKIVFNSDISDLVGKGSVEGSKATSEYLSFFRKINELQKEEARLQQKGMSFQMKKQEDSIPAVMQGLKALRDKSHALVVASIDSVLPSLSVFTMVNYLDFQSDLPYLKKVSDEMNKAYPDSKYTKLLSSEVAKGLVMKKQEEEKEKTSKVGIGKKAPEIALPNPNGKIVKLSDYKGKYVMLDFWASWCGPCRMENPHVVELYKKYKNKGFNILGVSLDEDKEKWKTAIMKDGLAWEQISDLKGWSSAVNPIYEVQAIPLTFLIDKEGTIIAKNLRGPELTQKLEEIFGK